MKPNILKFWFWRARLMVAGLHDGKDKIAKIQVNEELSIELHPASGSGKRPCVKLCRNIESEQQMVTIYLKEIPLLVEVLPRTIAQLMAFGAAGREQRNHIPHMELIKSRPELVE